MCNLSGVFGAPGRTMVDIFNDLLIVGQLRGDDSTGAGLVHKETGPFYLKHTVLPQDLIAEDDYQEWFVKPSNMLDNFLLMGHNRAATIGTVNTNNAHPFLHGHIMLTHNGTVTSKERMARKKKNKEWCTDSEAICYSIFKHGIDATYKKIIGAAALVWWDDKEKTLNFVRNAQRPLFVARTISDDRLLWASEAWMLRGAAMRHRLTLHSEGHLQPIPHELFTIQYDDKTRKLSYSHRKLESYIPKTTPHHHYPNQARRQYHDEYDDEDWFQYWREHNHYRANPETYIERQARLAKEQEKKQKAKTPAEMLVGGGDKENTRRVFNVTKQQWEDKPVVPYQSLFQSTTHNDDVLVRLRNLKFSCVKHMSEERFREQYKKCVYCGEPLHKQFKTAIIVDSKRAICVDCSTVAQTAITEYPACL